MSSQVFNIGTEMTMLFVINGQTWEIPGLLESTERKVDSHLLEKIPTNNDGKPVFRTTYSGYEYDCSLTRVDDYFDDLVTALVDNYYGHGPEPVISATETIINQGSVSMWNLSGGAIVPESLGTFKGADAVDGVTFKVKFSDKAKQMGANTAPASLNSSNIL